MNKLYLYLATLATIGSVFNLILHSTPAIAQETATPSNNTVNEPRITSVSQLSDIQPNDWAYQALLSLVERYGVIAGYPDGTFKGNRPMTRYEFAAGLNAALDKVNQLIAAGLADKVSKEDLATLQRLQQEFSAELATLRGRVDNLEAKAAELEANQFSTTTKLTGQGIFAINAGTQSGTDNPNAIFFSRTRINLETSFTGKDKLLTQFQAGTGSNGDATQFLQREEGDLKNRLVNAGEKLTQEKFESLFFPLNELGVSLEDLGLGLGKLNTVDEVRDTLTGNIATLNLEAGASREEALQIRQDLGNRIENARKVNNFLQINSKLDYSGADTGLKLNRLSYTFPLSEDFRVSFFPQGYASDYVDRNSFANNSANNFSTYGLVNNQLLLAKDTPGAGAAISWNPGKGAFTIRGVYRAEQAAFAGSNNSSDKQGGLFGGSNLGVAEVEYAPSKTVALRLQYSGGTQFGEDYSAVGANLEIALGEKVGIFGRFGHAFNFLGNIQPSSWSAGLIFKDLFAQGALAGVSVGQPLIFQDKDDILGLFNSTQTNYEAFYKLPVNDNISISPVLQVITDPGNTQASTIVTGTLRTVFSF
jgi:Carbohydrate-selective porin, OprB family/S-layer homology domain